MCNKIPLLRPLAVVISAALVASCSVANIHKIKKEVRSENAQVQNQMPKVSKRPALEWTETQWVNRQPLPLVKTAEPAPHCQVTHLRKSGSTLQEIAQFITAECGLRVVISPDVIGANSAKGGQTAVIAGDVPPPDNDISDIPGTGFAQTTSQPAAGGRMVLNNLFYQGELAGFLDLVASRAGISRKIEDGQIIFYRLETKTYALKMLNTQLDSTASISSGATSTQGSDAGTSFSGSAMSAQNTTVGQKYDLYGDIEKSIQAMLTPGEGRFWLSASSATLTVTDSPQVHRNIARYVDAQNEIMNRQVSLHVQILNVSSEENEKFGIDWTGVYNSLSNTGATLTSPTNSIEGAVSGGLSILESATGQAAKFSGSSLLIKALSKQGDVSVVTTQASTVTNMTPVPLQRADQTGFVKSVTRTNSKDTADSSTMETGTITTGFNMTMLPLIQAGGNVQLQVSLNISDPPVIRHRENEDGSGYVEMPSTRVRSLSQKVNLREGQSLILSGFDQHSKESDLAGTFSAANPLLGGAQSASKGRSTMIVIITPTFPDRNGGVSD